MGQEDLENSVLDAVNQQSGTKPGHGRLTLDSQHLVAATLELEIHGFDRPPTASFLDEPAYRAKMRLTVRRLVV